MGKWEPTELPNDLLHAQRRIRIWRQQRLRGERIPDFLWAQAVRLVPSHGVSLTARTLGLDYYSLKRRAEETGNQPQANSPAFVELPSPLVVGKQALFELSHGTGFTKRVHLQGYDASEVEALARSFWNAD